MAPRVSLPFSTDHTGYACFHASYPRRGIPEGRVLWWPRLCGLVRYKGWLDQHQRNDEDRQRPSSLGLQAPSFLSPSPLPQVARQFPSPMPMVLKVRLGTTPVVTLHTNNATLWLQPFVEVLAVASNSAFQSLFSLNVVSEVGCVGLSGRVATLK